MDQEHAKNISSNSSGNEVMSESEEMDLRKGPWTVDEDLTLINYIALHGEGRWNSLARCAGLKRTGKSCRLRWLNYLRPDVRRGNITLEEQLLILELHSRWGNRWSKIAQHLPGRTDNEIKNYWRTRVQKHAKQLKCDVNSKQFKDTMRYLWMPRLIERIQAASGKSNEGNNNHHMIISQLNNNSVDYNDNYHRHTHTGLGADHNQMVQQKNVANGGGSSLHLNNYASENSSAGSDSSGTPVSDLTECFNSNYKTNNNNNNDNYHPGRVNEGNGYASDDQDYYPASQLNSSDYGNHHQSSLISPTSTTYLNQGLDFIDQQQYNQWMDGGDHMISVSADMSLWNNIADDMWFLNQQF